MRPLRIAHVAPVATSVPPQKSGSVQTMTSLLTEGLVDRGHDVTLFAPGHSITRARLHATFPLGYREDQSMWPWEMYELLNLAAAVERADEFDIIHYEAEYFPMSLAFTRLSRAPVSQTLHHAPDVEELTLWRRYPDAPFIAISREQARLLDGLNVAAVVPHGIDTDRFVFNATPDDYLLFLGRFTEGKGPVQAIEVAKRTGMRLLLAAAEEQYYHDAVKPLVDHKQIVYVGEVDFDAGALWRRAHCCMLMQAGGRSGSSWPAILRNAGRRTRPRRRSRARRRRSDRRRVRRRRRDGERPRPGADSRSEARPGRSSSPLRHHVDGRRLRRRLPQDRRAVESTLT